MKSVTSVTSEDDVSPAVRWLVKGTSPRSKRGGVGSERMPAEEYVQYGYRPLSCVRILGWLNYWQIPYGVDEYGHFWLRERKVLSEGVLASLVARYDELGEFIQDHGQAWCEKITRSCPSIAEGGQERPLPPYIVGDRGSESVPAVRREPDGGEPETCQRSLFPADDLAKV